MRAPRAHRGRGAQPLALVLGLAAAAAPCLATPLRGSGQSQVPPLRSQGYDCSLHGEGRDQEVWPVEQQAWCCEKEGVGCPSSITTTETPGPTAAATSTTGYDCDHGYQNWKMVWTIGQQGWCCQHAGRACPDDVDAAPRMMSLPFGKLHDCQGGQPDGWSEEKRQWCCAEEAIGCADASAAAAAATPAAAAAAAEALPAEGAAAAAEGPSGAVAALPAEGASAAAAEGPSGGAVTALPAEGASGDVAALPASVTGVQEKFLPAAATPATSGRPLAAGAFAAAAGVCSVGLGLLFASGSSALASRTGVVTAGDAGQRAALLQSLRRGGRSATPFAGYRQLPERLGEAAASADAPAA